MVQREYSASVDSKSTLFLNIFKYFLFGVLLINQGGSMVDDEKHTGNYKRLDEARIPILVDAFKHCYVLRRAALLADEAPYHVKKWMEKGERHANKRMNTPYAQLFLQVGKNLSNLVAIDLNTLKGCPKNWQALAWRLEKCFPDDFGKDAALYQELLTDYKLLIQQLTAIQPRQGVIINASPKRIEAQENSEK